jgi:hypothetical protein
MRRMRLKLTPLRLAMESIDFQLNGPFFKELTTICRELEKLQETEIADSEIAMQLPAVIKHHTGMNVTCLWGSEELSVIPPNANNNNPLYNRMTADERQDLPNADADKILYMAESAPVGRVNLKTGMVSGVFAEFVSMLTLPVRLFASIRPFTAEEKAAGILHELGHLVSFFVFLAHTATTNQILSAISKKYDQTTSVKEREVILTKVKSMAKLNELDAAALAKSNDKKVVEVVVITSLVRQFESELGSNVYDMNTWEALADQYATRQGAGRHLLTFLDKAHRADGNIAFRSTPKYLFMEAFKLMWLAIAPYTMGVSLLFLLAACFRDSNDSGGVYDTLKSRYGRVRDQIVEAMKDKKLTEDQVTGLTQDLTIIDDLMNHVKERQQLFGYVMDFISPWQRQRISQEKLQRELERLAHNDLFVRAANLKQLGA